MAKLTAAGVKAAMAEVMKSDKKKKPNGKTSDKAAPKNGEAFQCLHSDCKAANRRWMTHKGRDMCFICCRPKAVALAPKPGHIVEWAKNANARDGKPPPATSPPGQGSSKAAKSKPAAGANADEEAPQRTYAELFTDQANARVPVVAPLKKMDLDLIAKEAAESKLACRKVAFTEEQAASFRTAAPALLTIFETLEKERRPSSTTPHRDAGETADAFIKDSKPMTRGMDLQKAEEEVAKLQVTQGSYPIGSLVHTAVTTQLKEAMAQVTKLQKESPSDGLKASCLEEIVAAYRRAATTRKDRAGKGKEAALERRARRAELLQKICEELTVFQEELETLEDDLQGEYQVLSDNLDDFDEDVLSQIQEKVGNEGAQFSMSLDKGPDPLVQRLRQEKEQATATAAAAQATAAAASSNYEMVATRVKELEEKLAAAEAEKTARNAKDAHATLQATCSNEQQSAAQQQAQLELEFRKALQLEDERVASIPLDPRELPELSEVSEENLKKLALAHAVLQKCAMHGALVQPTFEDVGLTAEVLQMLLGDAFTRLYRDSSGELLRVPGGKIAKRAQGFLFIALQKLSEKITKLNTGDLTSIEELATNAFTAITEGVQNRVQPY